MPNELITMTEMAALAGISLSALYKMQSRLEGFPERQAGSHPKANRSTPLYSKKSAVAWIKRHDIKPYKQKKLSDTSPKIDNQIAQQFLMTAPIKKGIHA